MKEISKLSLILLILISLVACSNNDDNSTSSEYKKEVIWAINNDQDTLDPQFNVSNEVILPQVYSSLLTIDLDNKVAPDLATEWNVDEDGKTWTFKLREGVTFHNGSAFTSKDVVATFNRLLDTNNPTRYTDTYSFIESVEAPSDYEVVIKTKDARGGFETDMASPNVGILSSEVLENADDQFGNTPESIVGTGPYRVTDWTIGEEMVLESFNDYYLGAPKTEKFVLRVISEQNSREIGLENHEFDIASGISPDAVARYQNGEVEGVNVYITEGNGMHLFQFGNQGILQDTKLRQAINYAIDKEAIVDALFASNGEKAATAPITPSVAGYKDLGVVKQDQAKAKVLMSEAGYPDGFTIKLMTNSVYNKGVEMAEIIKEQLAEVGINVEIETVERAVFLGSFGITKEEFAYDMFIMGAGGSANAGRALNRVWHTEEPVDGIQYNNNNYGFYSNARVDELLEEGAVTVDKEKSDAIYAEVQQIIWEDDPVGVFMNFRNNINGISSNVENFNVNARNTPDLKSVRVKE